MLLLLSRFFLLLLLFVDWADDPYFGQSPLSRPLASQDAFCHSLVHRATLLKASTLSWNVSLVLQARTDLSFRSDHLPLPKLEVKHLFLPATDPLYALMSLQC
jgi:hypothetical protein